MTAVPRALRWRAVPVILLGLPLLSLTSFTLLASWLTAGRPRIRREVSDEIDTCLADWVDTLLRRLPWPWRYTCLKRAVVLFYLLRCSGRSVTLYIGVHRSPGGRLEAHAWLMRHDRPYLESEPETPARFRVIARFPEQQHLTT